MLRLKKVAAATANQPLTGASQDRRAFVAAGKTVHTCVGNFGEFATTPFAITHLALNNSGTLLAAVGGNRIQVFNTQSKHVEAAFSAPAAVVDVAWHPLGVNDSCLVVLVAGQVVTFVLSSRGLVTETLYLKPADTGTYSADLFCDDLVSLAFGKGDTTGPVTLLLATGDGDLYGLCPFLPPEFASSRGQLRGLLDHALASEYAARSPLLNAASVDDDRVQRQMLKRQLTWTQEILREASTQVLTNDIVLRRPQRPAVALQGPLPLVPFPDRLYDAEVLDIATMEIEKTTLIVQLTTISVNFFLQDSPLHLSWSSCLGKRDPVTLVESVSVPALSAGELDIIGDYVFVQAPDSTLCLQITEWVGLLSASMQSGAPLPELPPTTVERLDKSTLAGFATFVRTTSLETLKERKWPHASRPQPKQQSIPPVEPVEYVSLVKGSAVDMLDTLLRNISLKSMPAGPLILANDAESLAKLNSLASEYERNMALLYKSIDGAVNHTHLLRAELYRQLAKVQAVQDMSRRLESKPVMTKLETLCERQTALQARMSQLAQRLESGLEAPLPLSEQERKFQEEIKRIQRAISTNSPGLASRVASVDRQARQVQAEGVAPKTVVSNLEIRGIEARLDDITDRLAQLMSELKMSGLKSPPPRLTS